MKTRNILVLTLALMAGILAANFIVGCSENKTVSGPDLNIVDIPFISTDTTGIALNPGSVMVDSTGIMDRMIAKMDLYVTTDSTGMYSLDYAGFLKNEGTNLTFEERKIADNLNHCVPIANAKIAEMRRSPQPTALAAYYSVSWWGVKVCFTGTTAQQIANVVQGGGIVTFQVPVLAAAISLGGLALQMYYTAWGGYCLNVPWTFVVTRSGMYISRP